MDKPAHTKKSSQRRLWAGVGARKVKTYFHLYPIQSISCSLMLWRRMMRYLCFSLRRDNIAGYTSISLLFRLMRCGVSVRNLILSVLRPPPSPLTVPTTGDHITASSWKICPSRDDRPRIFSSACSPWSCGKAELHFSWNHSAVTAGGRCNPTF